MEIIGTAFKTVHQISTFLRCLLLPPSPLSSIQNPKRQWTNFHICIVNGNYYATYQFFMNGFSTSCFSFRFRRLIQNAFFLLEPCKILYTKPIYNTELGCIAADQPHSNRKQHFEILNICVNSFLVFIACPLSIQ